MRAHPGFPWLDATDVAGLRTFLAQRGWLSSGESLIACERAGDGNMNLTLRVRTDRRSLIVKQARPWVEKYDHIAAPWERGESERWFYERVGAIPAVATHVPRLLASDPDARVLVLEDLAGARDCTPAYAGERLEPGAVDELARVLRALHDGTAGDPPGPAFNRAMRELNHLHCFVVPFDRSNGLTLDRFEPGLASAATALAADASLRARVEEMGARYLDAGGPLLHGDWFPGSWLRTAGGLRVIDPEFCFQGEREIDVGCGVAHLVLARQPPATAQRFLDAYGACDVAATARYAAVEVLRRLIGVAQLPIAPSDGWRSALLARARDAALVGDPTRLWMSP